MSFTGIFPPFCDPNDGHYLVDGCYVNNLPGKSRNACLHVCGVQVRCGGRAELACPWRATSHPSATPRTAIYCSTEATSTTCQVRRVTDRRQRARGKELEAPGSTSFSLPLSLSHFHSSSGANRRDWECPWRGVLALPSLCSRPRSQPGGDGGVEGDGGGFLSFARLALTEAYEPPLCPFASPSLSNSEQG
jgi:hypothetical protein